MTERHAIAIAAASLDDRMAGPMVEEHVRRDRVLDAIETIMILDDCAEFRVVARRRYLEITGPQQ